MVLALRDVEVRRGAATVLQGLDLEIRPGRIFWIVGPNGAGKTSLLRVVAGLDRPWRGRVVRDPPGARLGYFHAEMRLPPRSTVAGWDRLIGGLGPSHAGARTRLWPGVPGGRRIDRLSTGEHKRLLLDPLLRIPGPILLDEPYEHLSPDARAELGRLLESRARQWIVVVATNQLIARAEADGGLRLEAGAAGPIGVAGP